MKVLIIKNGQVEVKDIKHDIDVIKNEIDIPDGYIDIVTRKFKDEYLDIFVDDEALLHTDEQDMQVSGICSNGYEALIGSILIASSNREGETIGLTDEQINKVKSCIRVIIQDVSINYQTCAGDFNIKIPAGYRILSYEA